MYKRQAGKILLSPEPVNYQYLRRENQDASRLWQEQMCKKYIEDPIIQEIYKMINVFYSIYPYSKKNPIHEYVIFVKNGESVSHILNDKYWWLIGHQLIILPNT